MSAFRVNRQALLAAIHIGKDALAWDDEFYRQMLTALTGHNSCRCLQVPQLLQVQEHMRRCGWDGRARKRPTPIRSKIYALWAELARLGAVKEDSKQACDRWAARQLNCSVSALKQHADADFSNALERLKQWRRRISTH